MEFHGQLGGRAGRRIFIKIAGEGDLVADLALALVDPGIGGKGQHLAGKVGLYVFLERHVLGIAAGGVGLGLAGVAAPLFGGIGGGGRGLLRAGGGQGGALHGNPGVAEVGHVKDLAQGAFGKVAIQAADLCDGVLGDVVALVAQGLAAFFVQAGGIDELHLAAPGFGLVLAEQPDIGGDAGIVKNVVGQGDDGVEVVVFEDVAAYLGGAAARIAGEEGRAVLDDGRAAFGLEARHGRLEEEHLAVRDAGQAGAKAAFGPGGFAFHGGFFVFPFAAERRVGQHIVKGLARELVVGEGVAQLDVVGILPLDEHVRLADGEGLVIDLLPAQEQARRAVATVDVLLGHGEHAARAAGRVIDGRSGARAGQSGVVVGEQQVDHQLDDLARGVVLPGVLVVRFGKAADEFFKNVAHLQIGDAGGVQIGLAGGEFLEHHVEHVLLGHGGEVRPKRFKALQDLAHVGGKGVTVGPEVRLQIIGGVQQSREGEGAAVVEFVPCCIT